MRAPLFLAAVAPVALMANPAIAQTVNPTEQTASEPVDGNEIVVTAQRQSQRLQDVPLSVQAVSAQGLNDRGVTDLTQLSTVTPSLQVRQDNNYTVRGVGTQSFANSVESSVATALDEVTLGSRYLNTVPLLDLERIEVLNGPQGLLFGKNASAGLVNIVTARPELGHLGADFDMQATMSDRPGKDALGTLARAALNVPIGDRSALRLNTSYTYREPSIFYRDRNHLGRKDTDFRQFGGRAKYLFEPTDALSFYLIGEYFESHGVGTNFDNTYRQLAPNSTNIPALTADGVTAGPRNFVQVTDGEQYRDLTTGGAQGSVSYDLGNGMALSNIFAWKTFTLAQQIDIDYTGSNGANINRTNASYDQYSNELRLTLPAGNALSGQAGLYFFRSSFDQNSNIAGNSYLPGFVLPTFPFCVGATVSTPSPPGCSRSNSFFLGTDKQYTVTNTSYAGFGQLTYEFSDQFNIFAGGRVTRDKVAIDLVQNRGRYFVTLGFANGVYDQSYSNTNFSWKVGGQFKPSRDVMIYASYGRGYKGPGMNDTGTSATANLAVLPEITNTAEVGLKSSFLDHKVTFNLSAFHTKFDNFQIQSFDQALRTFVLGNAAEVTSKGLEGSLDIRPVRGLTLTANGALIDSSFDRYLAPCYATQSATVASCAANNTFDATGYRLAYAPKFSGTIGARYETPADRDGMSSFVQAELYHRSRIETEVNHVPGSQIGAIDLLNGSVGVRSRRWTASLFCRNCTNEIYPLSIGPESGDAAANPPRLSFTQRFGLDSIRTIGLRFGFNY